MVFSNNYSNILGTLWQYYRGEPNDNIANPESFPLKLKITAKTSGADNKKMLRLKYLSNF